MASDRPLPRSAKVSASPPQAKNSTWEGVKAILSIVAIVFGLRSFIFEPFNIPSGSMVPTLLVGDYLIVSKYSYGFSHYSFPFSPDLFSGRIFGRVPHRGDVAVFKWPGDNSTDYIKRIVGLPGDRLQMRDGQLYLNGAAVPREKLTIGTDKDDRGISMMVQEFTESLPDGPKHLMQTYSSYDRSSGNNTGEFIVPPGNVFAMGDNRDNSADSRFPVPSGVGYVPLENLVGRAEFIFFSVDGTAPFWEFWEWPGEIRWSRLLHGIT